MNKRIYRNTDNVSQYLRGPVRLEDETFTDYKVRMKAEKKLLKIYFNSQFNEMYDPKN